MHLIVSHASALSEGCQHTLGDLALPHLTRLLALLAAGERDEGDEFSLSPPHERELGRLCGLQGADGRLPWAAFQAEADGIDVGTLAWGLLTPCHWHVGTDQITMLDPQTLQLDEAESRELLDAVRTLFEPEGWTMAYGAPLRWYGAHPSLAGLATASPDRVAGRNLHPWMPEPDASRLIRRLLNEVQMLLYTHPVNDRRIERGLAPVNSFWLSGCGPRQPASRPSDVQFDDSLRAAAVAEDWADWAEAWQRLDAGPIAAALKAHEAGQPLRLTLCGERSAQRFEPPAGGWWSRLGQRFRPPRAADVLLAL